MTATFSGRSAAALIDEKIKQATAEVHALDHALQLAHGTGEYRSICAAKDAWAVAFRQLSRLIQQRRRTAK